MGEGAHRDKGRPSIQMKALTIALLFAIALPLAVRHSDEARLKQCQVELAAETSQADILTQEIRGLKRVEEKPVAAFSAEEAAELAKLRNQISQTRQQLKETNRLSREI